MALGKGHRNPEDLGKTTAVKVGRPATSPSVIDTTPPSSSLSIAWPGCLRND
jgi:hypothetical protein